MPVTMTLSAHLTMPIYQGAPLSRRLNTGVLIIVASGGYYVGRASSSITRGLSSYRAERKTQTTPKGLATKRFPLLCSDAPSLTSSMNFVMDAQATSRRSGRLTITTAFGILGVQVMCMLDCTVLFCCYPTTTRANLTHAVAISIWAWLGTAAYSAQQVNLERIYGGFERMLS